MLTSHRMGFSLIEILICLLIIVILIAITLPILKSVRESGRNTICKSNLHQFTIACHSYVQDYKLLPMSFEQNACEMMELPPTLWICPSNTFPYPSYRYPASPIDIGVETTQAIFIITRVYQNNPSIPFVEDYYGYHPQNTINVCDYSGAVKVEKNRVTIVPIDPE